MLIDQDKELKDAVLNLSVVEKDKLLLKLISKDVVLLEQLRYKLIDSKTGDNNKFEYTKRGIDVYFERLVKYRSDYTSSPGYFMMDMRNLSGAINDYLLVTKDKLGETDLRIYIFEKLVALNLSMLKKADKQNQKLLTYLANRIEYILGKYSKLHEDHQFDLKERLNLVLNYIKETAIQSSLQKK